jgi:hypothetical protein
MAIETVNSSSSLAEVIDRILDKGVVIDVWIRVSLVGIELLVVEARIVLASVETYLKYAEVVGLTSQAAVPRRAVAGLAGLAGVPGLSAVPGVAGASAVPGVAGVAGASAVPGVAGVAGASAVPGVAGASAVPGVAGVAGAAGVQDYVSRTPISSTSSYATEVFINRQPSTVNPTDVV